MSAISRHRADNTNLNLLIKISLVINDFEEAIIQNAGAIS